MNALNIPDTNLKRIVIIGCGFGGLQLAKKLAKQAYQVVMLDKHNYHTFQPLLYQVATAGLEPDSIAYPIRRIFKGQKNFYFRLAAAQKVEASQNVLHTNIGPLQYDYLVIATGSTTNYFGLKGVAQKGLPMKNIPEALNLRSLILENFEKAALSHELSDRQRLMNFVIVGAGPTGVELAGALAELKTHVLPNDYPDLDFRQMSIHLIEAMDKVLPPMSDTASKKSLKYLTQLGVQVWTDTKVANYDGKDVYTDKKTLPASTLIWAAGVKGASIEGLNEQGEMGGGRYLVNEFNQVGSHQNIFAIGDVAAMQASEYPKGHPMLAQVAMQQGQHLAKNFKAWAQNKKPQNFKYKDPGTMATVGRNKAVVDLGTLRFGGFAGWLVWMFVHLMSLVGFKNKAVVLTNWVLSYFSYDKKMRLIIRPFQRQNFSD